MSFAISCDTCVCVGTFFVSTLPYILSMLDFGGDGAVHEPPVRVFESASILVYLCEHYDPQNLLMPADSRLKAECMNWVSTTAPNSFTSLIIAHQTLEA